MPASPSIMPGISPRPRTPPRQPYSRMLPRTPPGRRPTRSAAPGGLWGVLGPLVLERLEGRLAEAGVAGRRGELEEGPGDPRGAMGEAGQGEQPGQIEDPAPAALHGAGARQEALAAARGEGQSR